MLEPAGHESRNGHGRGEELVGDRGAGEAHPHREADEDVAEDAAEEHGAGGETRLGGGDRDRDLPHRTAAKRAEGGQMEDEREQQRTDEVAGVDDRPTGEHALEVVLPGQQADGHERVAREELRAGDEDEEEPEREREAAQHGRDAEGEG